MVYINYMQQQTQYLRTTQNQWLSYFYNLIHDRAVLLLQKPMYTIKYVYAHNIHTFFAWGKYGMYIYVEYIHKYIYQLYTCTQYIQHNYTHNTYVTTCMHATSPRPTKY